MPKMGSSRVLPRAGLVVALLACAATWPRSARAIDPRDVSWSPDWPRVRWWEAADVAALTIGSFVIDRDLQAPSSPSWGGGVLFDDAIRRGLRGTTPGARSAAADLSDSLYTAAVIAPYVVDVYAVTLGVHENADVAVQMALINLQSLGLTGVVSLVVERTVARARPSEGYDSFYSGHAAATATMAGLTCAHHQHLPLYGGGFADLAACLVMIGVSATTGVARVVADRHWATDVVTGWAVGALSGYVLPSLLHYGFTSGHPVLETGTKGVRIVPVPQAYVGGAGLGVAGLF